eukprot:NODE_339_length_10647_cov_0.388320.p4 type:complete len:317 gc:universal NODE_339_length_10647_cov_0.388320:7993-7043(-)
MQVKKPIEPRTFCLYSSTATLMIFSVLLLFGVIEVIINLSIVGALVIWACFIGLFGTISNSIALSSFLFFWSILLLISSMLTSLIYLVRLTWFVQNDTLNGVIAKNDLVSVWTAFSILNCILIGIALLLLVSIFFKYRKYLLAMKSYKSQFGLDEESKSQGHKRTGTITNIEEHDTILEDEEDEEETHPLRKKRELRHIKDPFTAQKGQDIHENNGFQRYASPDSYGNSSCRLQEPLKAREKRSQREVPLKQSFSSASSSSRSMTSREPKEMQILPRSNHRTMASADVQRKRSKSAKSAKSLGSKSTDAKSAYLYH